MGRSQSNSQMGCDRLRVGPKHFGDFRAGANPRLECLILSDLSAFDWMARNKMEVARTGTNHLDRLLSCRGAVNFLKSQTVLFRVQVVADSPPNIGDVFQIQTTSGGAVTMDMHYL